MQLTAALQTKALFMPSISCYDSICRADDNAMGKEVML